MKCRLYIHCLSVFAGIFTFSAVIAQSDTSFPYPPLGKLIDIGDWKLYLLGQGIDKQGPAIILEAGVGDFSHAVS